jgi:c-di-GMP-binding flagellar brake protein YcgR
MTVIRESNSEQNSFEGDDRRRYPRYPVRHDTLLYNESSLAEIYDISSGGMACRHVVGLEDDTEVITDVELLNCIMGFHVEGLSCRKVRDIFMDGNSEDAVSTQADCFFEFVDLNKQQEEDLGRFIRTCTHVVRPKIVYRRPATL